MRRLGWIGLGLICCVATAAAEGADEKLERLELKLPGQVISAQSADVDGDGWADVLAFWRQGVPPKSRIRISVFASRAGRVAPTPVQVLRLPESTAAFDVGDADGDGRADVLLLAADGVWSLPGRSSGRLAGAPIRLVKAMTLAAIPDEDGLPPAHLLVDLDGRGRRGLLVPTVPIGPLALYVRVQDQGWSLLSMLQVPARGSLRTSAEDFRSARDYEAVFQWVVPRLEVSDQNGDGLRDLLFFQRDSVSVFRARPDGGFAQNADLRMTFGLLTDEERLRGGYQIRGGAGDFNGDGRADLVFNKSSGGIARMTNQLRLFLARADGSYPARADLAIDSDGYGAFARPVDVDGDGRTDLVLPHVKMGILAMSQVLLTGRIDVDFQIHLARAGQPGAKPNFSLSSSFGVDFQSNQDLSGLYPIFGQDFTGDGVPDLVLGRAGGGSGSEPDRIEIRAGRRSGGFDDDALWSLGLHGTRAVTVFRASSDALPGLLIWFPSVRQREADVWVLRNTGRWR